MAPESNTDRDLVHIKKKSTILMFSEVSKGQETSRAKLKPRQLRRRHFVR